MSTAPTLVFSRAPLTDKDGNVSRDALKVFQQWATQLNNLADGLGNLTQLVTKLGANVTMTGRSGTLQGGIANLDASGVFNSLANVTDTSTDHLTDGTGTPLTGGKRGAQALDSNNRLVSSFHQNQVDVSASPLSSTQLSNDGVSTVIPIASGSYQYGPGQVAYNSGSVDPGVFGKYYIYFDDPTFSGGAVSFQFTNDPTVPVANVGRQVVGGITTSNAGASSGGGYSGGTSGKPGGRGYNTL